MPEKMRPARGDQDRQLGSRPVKSSVPLSSRLESEKARGGVRRNVGEVGNGKLKKKVSEAQPEELVKYMSSLPSYLQRPRSADSGGGGRALNVGVLEWSRLEQWKHEKKPPPARKSGSGYVRSSLAPTTAASSSSSASPPMPTSRTRTTVRRLPPSSAINHSESRDCPGRKVPNLPAMEPGRRSFAGDFVLKFKPRPPDVAHSGPLPCEFQSSKWLDVDLSTPVGVQVTKTLSNRLQPPSPDPKEITQRPSDAAELDATPPKLEPYRLSRSLSSKDLSSTPGRVESPKAGYASDNCKKAQDNGRSRQSPLRRLLGQVLKPKHQLSEEPTSAKKTTASSSPTSTVNALLQVPYKDGIPLFTLTSTAGGGILIARRKKVFVSGKDDFEWVYTIYSVEDVKKKGSGPRWMQQGRKGKKLETRLLGQMKASSNPKSLYLAKEFVLFGAGLSEVGHEANFDFVPSNQIAAIVMSLREEMHRCDSFCEIGVEGAHRKGVDVNGLEVTVILPNGVHGLPTEEGIPSPLIDRWRSNGSCDCGGWDLGCTLSVLDNQEQPDSSFPNAGFTLDDAPLLDLFKKVGPPESRLVFSFAASKEGIYSVEFSSTFSLLQAFSICVAVLHGKRPYDYAEACDISEGKTVIDPIEPQQIKLATMTHRKTPSYVSFPPISPVARA